MVTWREHPIHRGCKMPNPGTDLNRNMMRLQVPQWLWQMRQRRRRMGSGVR